MSEAQGAMDGIARQLTAVAIDGMAILIDGASGLGKSSLALTLIDRGARLVGDDSVLLDDSGDRLLVRPHPRTSGLIEVRNLGLIRTAPVQHAFVSLSVTLDCEAPRFIEAAGKRDILGHAVPHVDIWPTEATLMAFKVELALKTYGLFRGE
ncbi:HPr kinase/phosphorylase [Novosphingobium sp. 9]|uniref:HPr kinase/phosphorylase n=1 Tax=Novosphingobium sp. 9 TaxID=2025349 RepID=UPI0021B52114|nr:HPr kinase/phosphatase C-terminal domain-containing protein [Novosphingobium sp. 9]